MATTVEKVESQGERIATLEAQMKGTDASLKDVKTAINRLANKVWAIIVLLLANLLALVGPKLSSGLQ